jgi:hypothetical protein
MPGRRRRGTGACHRGPGRHGGARPGSGLGSQARGQKGPDESLISVTRPHGATRASANNTRSYFGEVVLPGFIPENPTDESLIIVKSSRFAPARPDLISS